MKQILVIAFVSLSLFVQAQKQLVFQKTYSSKTIAIKEKDLVKLAFAGYMGQTQIAEGIVSNLSDSTITLSPRKKLLSFSALAAQQTLYIKDIVGFRKYSKFRPAGEIIYGIAGIGIAGTVTAIVANAKLPSIASFGTAAATSAVTVGLKNAVLPVKIKHKLSDGWQMKLTDTSK